MKAKKNITKSEYEAMSHSQKLKYQRQRLKRKKRQRDRMIFSVVILFVCAVSIALSFTVFFKIENIEIEGSQKYTYDEILEKSQIVLNENMFILSTKKSSKNLEKSLPYIGKAEIKRVLPDKILIKISETKPMFAIKEGKTYSLVDENTKVLEKGVKKPKSNLIMLIGIDTKDIMPGFLLKEHKPASNLSEKDKSKGKEKDESLTIAEGESQNLESTANVEELEMQSILEVLASLIEGIKIAEMEDINTFDLSDINNLKIVYQNRISLILGTANNIERKLRLGKKVIEEENEKRPNRTGIIDLSVENKASVRQEEYQTLAPQTEEATDEIAEEITSNEDLE